MTKEKKHIPKRIWLTEEDLQKAYRGISHPDLTPLIITHKRKIKFLEDEYDRKDLEQGTENYQEKQSNYNESQTKGGHVIDWDDWEKYLKTQTRENRKIARSRLKGVSYRKILTSSLVLLKSTSSIKARFDKIIKGYNLWINQGKIV